MYLNSMQCADACIQNNIYTICNTTDPNNYFSRNSGLWNLIKSIYKMILVSEYSVYFAYINGILNDLI